MSQVDEIVGVAPVETPRVILYWARQNESLWKTVSSDDVYRYAAHDLVVAGSAKEALEIVNLATGKSDKWGNWYVQNGCLVRHKNSSFDISLSSHDFYLNTWGRTEKDKAPEIRKAIKEGSSALSISFCNGFDCRTLEDPFLREISTGLPNEIFPVEVEGIVLFCFRNDYAYNNDTRYVLYRDLAVAKRKFAQAKRNKERREVRSKTTGSSKGSLEYELYSKLHALMRDAMEPLVYQYKGRGNTCAKRYSYYQKLVHVVTKLCTKTQLKPVVPLYKKFVDSANKVRRKNPDALKFIAYATPLLLGNAKATVKTGSKNSKKK